jgi:DNA-binding CsgD family transcriptional regulator
MDGAPPEWREWCCRHRIDSPSDPKWSCALQEVTPILWRETAQEYSSLFGDARDHGTITGITYPVHAPHGDWSALSLVNVYDSRNGRQDIEASIAIGQLLACFVHGVVSRMVRRECDRTDLTEPAIDLGQPALSGRERECLQLASTGMTATEAADRLRISANTVIFHLKNARRKLGAANSRHALVRAIKVGIIKPS